MRVSAETEPRALFINNFPPLRTAAGPLLIQRLFAGLPCRWFHLICVSSGHREGARPENYGLTIFRILDPNGRWGWGRLKRLGNFLLIPFLAAKATGIARKKRSQVIVTVAHGEMCLVACLVSLYLNKPLVLFVHDDWPLLSSRGSFLPSYRLYGLLFRWILTHSHRVYVVSHGMARWLSEDFGVPSEVQYPAVDIDQPELAGDTLNRSCPRFLFLGNFGPEVADAVNLLVEGLKKISTPDGSDLKDWSFHLYTGLGDDERQQLRQAWGDDRVVLHPWATQQQLPEILSRADILVLPHSFLKTQTRFVNKSFPTKTTDYMRSGKPILVLAPPHSALNQYARRYSFAEVIEDIDMGAVRSGLLKLLGSSEYRRDKIKNCADTLRKNHDIRTQQVEFDRCLRDLARRSG